MRRYTINVKGQEYAIDVQELAADRFRVLVDGQQFEVTLAGGEDLAEALISPALSHPAAAPTAPAPPPAVSVAPPPAPRPAAPQPPTPGETRRLVTAPMPGLILALGVAPGQQVTHGQVLLTLEAMKMQNAIKSPQAGVVAELLVQPGQTVRHGQALVRFEEDRS